MPRWQSPKVILFEALELNPLLSDFFNETIKFLVFP